MHQTSESGVDWNPCEHSIHHIYVYVCCCHAATYKCLPVIVYSFEFEIKINSLFNGAPFTAHFHVHNNKTEVSSGAYLWATAVLKCRVNARTDVSLNRWK